MSNAANPTTRLQGSLYASAAFTIRLTYDPTGVPATSDFAVAAGTLYRSHAQFLSAWQLQVTADIGGVWAFDSVDQAGGRVKSRITSPGLNLSITWSHVGDGTAARNWLGEAGNVVNQASPYTFTNGQQAAFWPEKAAQRLARTSTARGRAQHTTLSAASRTQHGTSPSDLDVAELEVECFLGPTNAHTQQESFQQFIDDIEDYASREQFTLTHGSDTYYGYMPGDELRLECTPVEGDWDDLWRVSFPFVQLQGVV